MNFIIDTNILLSALIRDSTTRKIITEARWKFYYPEISLHELRKHKDLVKEKSGLSEQEYEHLINGLLQHIFIVPEEQTQPYLKQAIEIMSHIDPDDVIFIATALSINNSIIWTDDKDFDRQKEFHTIKTGQMITLFYSTENM